MEYIRIRAIAETDFDKVVVSAGGSRITEEGSADYRLNEAIIELKLVCEEGFEKTERQRKLAGLFHKTQPKQPVVVINAKQLNESDSRNYYRIVEVPIKNACKKASKQLQATAVRFDPQPVRVLVVLNVGYTLLSQDEFKDVCFRCVRNDTSGIDRLLCGGIYFHSDKFDNYVLAPLEELPINLGRSFPSQTSLLRAWGDFLNSLMTEAIRNPEPFTNGRMPVIDLKFDLDGIRYIKPAPAMPKSGFWPGGVAPRENSSGINSCPPVARTFPALSVSEWSRFKAAMPSSTRLKGAFKDWANSYPEETPDSKDPLKPLVFVDVSFEEFESWVEKPKTKWQFSDLAEFSSHALHLRVLKLLETAKDKGATSIFPVEYIHLVLTEVGNDKANDFASMFRVSELPGFEREEALVENVRLFFEYGMAVAAAYAIKCGVNAILFTKTRTATGTDRHFLVRLPDGFEKSLTGEQQEVLKYFRDRLQDEGSGHL